MVAGPEPQLFRILDETGAPVRAVPAIDEATLDAMLETMLLIRQLDERMMILQRQGRIGFYGACTGQEAGPIGTAAALDPSDWVFPGLREGAVMLYRGFSLETYICQVLGNDGDLLRGRQMPSHYAARSVGYVSWGSSIGTQIPQAVGAAWAAKIRGDRTITVGFMGDGATSEADFHNGMNFAGVYRVPCLLICQNNHWSISVPTARQSASRTIAEKAIAYGLPYARVDGNDVLAVYAAVSEAAERARRGDGPSFLELVTYRIGAHSSSDDPRVYRDEAEVERWKKLDPVSRFTSYLQRIGFTTAPDLERRRAFLGERIQVAVRAAEALGPPPTSSLFDDVYAEPPRHLAEQREELERFRSTP